MGISGHFRVMLWDFIYVTSLISAVAWAALLEFGGGECFGRRGGKVNILNEVI